MYGVDPDAVDDVVEHHPQNGSAARRSLALSNGDASDEENDDDDEAQLNDSNDNVILVATNKLLLHCSPVSDVVGGGGTTTTGIFVNSLHHHHDELRNGDAAAGYQTNGGTNGHSKMRAEENGVDEDDDDEDDDDEGVDEDIVAKGRLIPPALLSNGVEDGLINDDEEYICEYYSDEEHCENNANEANHQTNGSAIVKDCVGGTLHRRSVPQKNGVTAESTTTPTTNGSIKTVDMIVKCNGTNGDGDGIIAKLIVGWYTLYNAVFRFYFVGLVFALSMCLRTVQ